MPACKKSAMYLKYWANYMLFTFFLEVSEFQWSARFSIPLTTPIPTPYFPYLPYTKTNPYLPYTYLYLPIPTHTYPIPNLFKTTHSPRWTENSPTLSLLRRFGCHNPKAKPSNSNPTQKQPNATWLWVWHENRFGPPHHRNSNFSLRAIRGSNYLCHLNHSP